MSREAERSQRFPYGVMLASAAWLFLSAFLWPHTQPQFHNAWIVALASAAAAALSVRMPPVRVVSIALSIWLFFSAWVLPILTLATRWNSMIVASVMFIASVASASRTPSEPGSAAAMPLSRQREHPR